MSEPRVPRYSTEQVRRRRTTTMRFGVALVVVVGLLFVVVFPVRAWMDQRAAVDRSERQLEVLEQEQQRLTQDTRRLRDPREIERIARERYGMTRPGEQAWSVVPPSTTTTTTLPVAP